MEVLGCSRLNQSPDDFQLFNDSIASQMANSLYGQGNCVDQLNRCYATGDNEVCRGEQRSLIALAGSELIYVQLLISSVLAR